MRQFTICIILFFMLVSVGAEDDITYETLTIYATRDVVLRSNRPTINFNGKTEPMKGYGFGIKKAVKGGKISYPCLILEENKTVIAPHTSFVVGGFDYAELIQKAGDPVPKHTKSRIVSAKLRFFVNYASQSFRNMGMYVCRCNNNWHENKLTYNDMYTTLSVDKYGEHVVRKTHSKQKNHRMKKKIITRNQN